MKTTPEQFKEFKHWCLYYMEKYSINDWTVHFEHDEVEEGLAQTITDIDSRLLQFRLATNHESEDSIRSTAKHEVIHALVADVSDLIGKYCTQQQALQADEKLVCKLTNLLED